MDSFIFLAKLCPSHYLEKVSELIFNKVKNRWVNKYINLLCKKEGNITWESYPATKATPKASVSHSQAGSHPSQESPASREGSTIARHSCRFRALHSSQGDSTIAQVDSKVSQAGTASQETRSASCQAVRHLTSQGDYAIPQADSKVSQASAAFQEAGALPLLITAMLRQVIGTQLGLGLKVPKGRMLLPRQIALVPKGIILPPKQY